ncbi:hypothetical protein [Polaribacter sp. Q13]|uniref:hypothetical protein n=1 Tax=Polaribacter sp. Q13 TaxID=2806551 RepID=UPI00193BE8A9|nr:hypothetical protein [Polaribacter sp. Q13]QVY66889.1 hypothetical protein JOP69_06290 [Polaribacter sp. Q13]
MKKAFQILIIVLFSVSCSNSKKGIITENRTLYVFDFDSLKRTENYKLTIEIRDTITKYKYQNLTDESKNMDVFYIPKTKILKFAMWKYIPKNSENFKGFSLSKTEFVNYEMQEPETDGTGPILFNPEYGILGIGNVMAPNFVYLKNQSDSKILDNIIEKLTE